MQLPQFVGDWYGIDQPVSQGERDILGPDTEFVRKLYTNGRGGEIYVSIVLSGPDMNTSIHRPGTLSTRARLDDCAFRYPRRNEQACQTVGSDTTAQYAPHP